MSTTNLDYLIRLQNVLIETKQEYDVLQYISIDGMVDVTVSSVKRTVKIAIQPGPAVSVFSELSQAVYERIVELEKELASAIEEYQDEIGADHPLIATARALANGESLPVQSTAPTTRAAA
jgi:sRNA-binding carbon storage regulator CsrA